MKELYVVISYYRGDGGTPEVSFHPDADGAIKAVNDKATLGTDVTIYRVDDLPRLVAGTELRKDAQS